MVVKSGLIWTSHSFVASNYRTRLLFLFCDVVRQGAGLFCVCADYVNMANVILVLVDS